jgi:SAM-dependent methyltransferase
MSARAPSPSDPSQPPASFSPPPEPAERLGAIEAGEIVLCCDQPQTGTAATLPVIVDGWAYSRNHIHAVWVAIDGHALATRRGGLRPDVATAMSEPEAYDCGFTLELNDGNCAAGVHQLSIVAADERGHASGIELALTIEVPAEDVAALNAGEPIEAPARRLDNGGERYVPELHRGTLLQGQHEARYAWAASLAAGRDVLDAGCGVGWGSLRLIEGGARKLVGLDRDPAALASARERCGASAEFVTGDLLSLPFEQASFDLVVALDAIEHVEDPIAALDELRRVVAPDGIVIVSTPNRGVYEPGNPFHLCELTSDELRTALDERFEHSAIYRQQDYLASLIGDELLAGIDDPATVVTVETHKVHGEQLGEEQFCVALASDRPLPAMAPIGFLCEPLLHRELLREALGFERRAVYAETKVAIREAEISELTLQIQMLQTSLHESEQRRRQAERGDVSDPLPSPPPEG